MPHPPGEVHGSIPVHMGRDEVEASILAAREVKQQHHPLLVRQIPVLVEDEVAQSIEHIDAIDVLYGLHHVGVVPHHHIGPGLHRHLGKV